MKMTELERKIREFYEEKGIENDGWLDDRLKDSIDTARTIAEYAHATQVRINGELYFHHPENLLRRYRGIVMSFKFDGDLCMDLGIPVIGVQELCYLHDVIEDTDVTLDEIMELIRNCKGKKRYCHLTELKEALIAITHKKDEPFEDYYNRLLENPLASFVKMFDIEDNMRLLNLVAFGEKEYERAKRYVTLFYRINEKYHYVEKLDKYSKSPRNIYDDWEDW